MYSQEIGFTVRYKDIELNCTLAVSKVFMHRKRTSKDDNFETFTEILHKGEDITDLLSEEQEDEILTLCYQQYYK